LFRRIDMWRLITFMLLAVVLVVSSNAFARNDGGDNGAGCTNNCGNKPTPPNPPSEPPPATQGGEIVGNGAGLGVGYATANASASAANSQSSNVSVDSSQSNDYSGMYDEYVAPAFSPELVATGDCMGSASAGGSGAAFGFSLGKTYIDEGCNARADSRHLWSMGLHEAATKRLCSQPQMAAAINEAKPGYCPEVDDETRDVYPSYYE
jgi:hypothetical protein